MVWLAARSLLARRLSALVTGFGMLIATVGFSLLASTSQTAAAVLHGDIASTWDTPYDLLIRPPDSLTEIEGAQGLVRPNYVSALGGGGITVAQLAAIRQLPSVDVAAPIAISGYAFWRLQGIGVVLPRPKVGDPVQVYRISVRETADAGASTYPIQVHYLVVSSTGWFKVNPRTLRGELTADGIHMTCASTAVTGDEVSCWAPNQCFGDTCGPAEDPPGYGLEMLQPVLVAGIDPIAEAKLAGLDRCLVGGRYLDVRDVPQAAPDRDPPGTVLPALVSDRSFIDATMTATLDQAADPKPIVRGTDPERVAGWTHSGRVDQTVDSLYHQYLAQVGQEVDEWPLWSAGDVAYTQEEGGGSLVAASRSADQAVLQRANFQLFGAGEMLARPPELQDSWFRQIRQHGYTGTAGDRYWSPVGTYNPECLPGFNQLAGGAGLEAYAVPRAKLADGRELLPNRSLAGYLNTPPVILTTLDSAAWLADPSRFSGGAGKSFISAIRVRISGLDGPAPSAERKLARVAAEIREATGLAVDVVKGSSTKPITVDLPAGRFGRPPMHVMEGWSVKGVAIRFTNAVSLQNLALFALALLAAAVLVGTTTYIAARRRHAEFGVLRALGWPTWRIGGLVVAETALLGIGVGLLTIVVSFAAAAWLPQGVIGLALISAVPLALGIGVVAALPAALATSRSTTISRIARPSRRRSSRPIRSVAALGLADMVRTWKVEAFAAAAIIGLSAAVLATLILIVVAFRGELDATVLGTDLAGRVRPFHFVLAGMTVLIASLGGGQIFSLSYLERRPHLAMLRALGWSRADVRTLIAAQALGIGVCAAILMAGAMLAATAATGAGIEAAGLAIAAGMASVIGSTLIAAAVPVAGVYAGTVLDALREE